MGEAFGPRGFGVRGGGIDDEKPTVRPEARGLHPCVEGLYGLDERAVAFGLVGFRPEFGAAHAQVDPARPVGHGRGPGVPCLGFLHAQGQAFGEDDSEDIRMSRRGVQRDGGAQARAAHARAFRTLPDPERPFHARHHLADKPVDMANALRRDAVKAIEGQVLGGAPGAGVWNADDNEGPDLAGGDQRTRGLIHSPFAGDAGEFFEEILAVVHVEHGVRCLRVARIVVSGGKPDEQFPCLAGRGAGAAAGQTRELLVWLPPGYDDPRNAQATYPVLYMHDGQNLFEKLPSVPGEWGMDETAGSLITSGEIRPLIIVGIPHSGPGRAAEYLPFDGLDGVAPQGVRHIDWLIREVMPRVERAFRVRKGPESTGVGGSSLGATIALHAATAHPDVFGIVLAESLPLRVQKPQAWDAWTAAMTNWPRRIYLGMGGAELGPEPDKAERNRSLVQSVEALDARMKAAGLGPDRRLLIIDPAATHTESAWAKRLPQALKFLFPTPVDSSK